MGSRVISSPNTPDTVVNPVTLSQGGTSSDTAAAAITALRAVPVSKLNALNGIAGLDSTERFPVSILSELIVPMISIKPVGNIGNNETVEVAVSTSINFEITNYDTYTDYVVAPVAGGTVTISGKIITYTAPASAGAYGFSINGKEVILQVKSSVPAKPVLSAITTGSYDTALKLTLLATSFANSPSGSATHTSTNWVIARNPDMSDIVYQSLADTINKTTLAQITIALNSTAQSFYAAVQYTDSNANDSQWSDIIKIDAKSHYIANQEIACLTNTADAVTSGFGTRMGLSDDGTRLVIANRIKTVSSLANAGGIYIYLRANNTWSLEATINNPEPTANGYFGRALVVDSTCTRIAVGAYGNLVSSIAKGAVYVFIRSGTTWTQEAKLVASDGALNDLFGHSITHANSFARLAVGAPNKNTGTGAVYTFIRSGSTWTQEAKLVASDGATGDQFGFWVSFAKTSGGQLAVTAPYKASGALASVGAVYVFARTNSVYTQESKLVPSDAVANDIIAIVEMRPDGQSMVVARQKLAKAELYKRVGSSYTLNYSFTSTSATVDSFGKEFWSSDDGSKVLIVNYSGVVNGLYNAGMLHLFELQADSSWTESKITAILPEEGATFSRYAAISSDMLNIAVSSLGANATLSTLFGSVHTLVTA